MRDFPFLLKYDHYFVQGGMGVGETIYGYVRVSTQDQNEARQLAAMRKFGVPEENVVVEKLSGKDFNRPR